MKKLLLRLRHWFIKKLGGYTEQTILPMVRYPPSVMLHPERVCAQARVSYEMLRGDRGRHEYFANMVKHELARKIVEEIIAKDFGVLTCEPDWQHGIEDSVYTMIRVTVTVTLDCPWDCPMDCPRTFRRTVRRQAYFHIHFSGFAQKVFQNPRFSGHPFFAGQSMCKWPISVDFPQTLFWTVHGQSAGMSTECPQDTSG